MPKSKVIIDAVNAEIPLEQSLRQLCVLAHDVGNSELEHWAESELSGYSDNNQLPEYRVSESLNFTYTGINNYALRVTNVSLPISFLSKDTLDAVKKVHLTDGISYIEKLSQSETALQVDCSVLAGEVSKLSNGKVQCCVINQNISPAVCSNVVAEVVSRVIKAFMLLEDQYGSLDDLGITVKSKAATDASNSNINSVVLNLPVPNEECETAGSKIAWNIIIPIVTAIVGAVLGAGAIKLLGWG